jgi:hypothetical protein
MRQDTRCPINQYVLLEINSKTYRVSRIRIDRYCPFTTGVPLVLVYLRIPRIVVDDTYIRSLPAPHFSYLSSSPSHVYYSSCTASWIVDEFLNTMISCWATSHFAPDMPIQCDKLTHSCPSTEVRKSFPVHTNNAGRVPISDQAKLQIEEIGCVRMPWPWSWPTITTGWAMVLQEDRDSTTFSSGWMLDPKTTVFLQKAVLEQSILYFAYSNSSWDNTGLFYRTS